jgi:hypothetical protein
LRTSTWSAYPVEYTTELDDARAGRIADRLRAWGAALFRAVFGGDCRETGGQAAMAACG